PAAAACSLFPAPATPPPPAGEKHAAGSRDDLAPAAPLPLPFAQNTGEEPDYDYLNVEFEV
ncbi:unnamed protein product, partial [Urochloa humidicola]